MKQLLLLLLVNLGMVESAFTQTQAIEQEIKQLEKVIRDAIVSHDTLTLFNILAQDHIVNSPSHQIANYEQTKGFIRARLIDYSLFETNLEKIQVYDNVVITMGNERLKPIGKALMAGQTVKRCYTHVWMKRKGAWKLVARHAHIIDQETKRP